MYPKKPAFILIAVEKSMTNEEFKSWINGYITLSSDDTFDLKQFRIIKNHAELVKTIDKKLVSEIETFLLHLVSLFKDKHSIAFNDFKKCAETIMLSFAKTLAQPTRS